MNYYELYYELLWTLLSCWTFLWEINWENSGSILAYHCWSCHRPKLLSLSIQGKERSIVKNSWQIKIKHTMYCKGSSSAGISDCVVNYKPQPWKLYRFLIKFQTIINTLKSYVEYFFHALNISFMRK